MVQFPHTSPRFHRRTSDARYWAPRLVIKQVGYWHRNQSNVYTQEDWHVYPGISGVAEKHFSNICMYELAPAGITSHSWQVRSLLTIVLIE